LCSSAQIKARTVYRWPKYGILPRHGLSTHPALDDKMPVASLSQHLVTSRVEALQSAVEEDAMHYSVQFFTWTPKQGVHQVGSMIEIDAVNPKLAAVSLLGLRLDETGAAKKLAVRVWTTPDDSKADCACFYYH
jgi:hypothetical protein